MRQVYGITGNSLHIVVDYVKRYNRELKRKGKKRIKVQVVGFDIEPIKNVNLLIIPSFSIFTRVIPQIKEKSIIFLLDAPALCGQIDNIILLDADVGHKSYLFKFKPLTYKAIKTALSSNEQFDLNIKQLDMIRTSLSELKSSLLQKIMNFLYSVKNKETRTVIQQIVFNWLLSDEEKDFLIDQLQKTLKFKKQPKSLTTLFDTLNTSGIEEIRKTMKEIKELKKAGKPVNYKKLQKNHLSIDIFDVRYLLQMNRKISRDKIGDVELSSIYYDRKTKKEKKDV